jgi:hypothetical protein
MTQHIQDINTHTHTSSLILCESLVSSNSCHYVNLAILPSECLTIMAIISTVLKQLSICTVTVRNRQEHTHL